MQTIPKENIRGWLNVAGSRTPQSVSTVCPHCSEKTLFAPRDHSNDPHRLTIASSAFCAGCNKKVHFWAVREENTPKSPSDDPIAVYMYPVIKNHYPHPEFTSDVPEALRRSLISTIDSLNAGNFAATTVCARRTLEGIFKYLVDENERKHTLAKLIENVSSSKDLAAPLKLLSHAIRDGGNLGAHFDMEKEPDENISRQMVELLNYLISYLYVLPKEIEKLEQSLGRSE